MKILLIFLMFLAALFSLPLAGIAQHAGHQMPGMPGMEGEKKPESSMGRETSSTRAFLLEGVKASFTIMPIAEHKKMLQEMKMDIEVDPKATHNIAVTLTDTQTNQVISNAVVKMKVIDPKGKAQIKLLDFILSMNQYAGDFFLSEKGRYQILILFKAGGKKQAAGFYYLLS